MKTIGKGIFGVPDGQVLTETPDGVTRTFGDCDMPNSLMNSRSASGGPAGYGYGPFAGGDAGGSYGAFPDDDIFSMSPIATSGVTDASKKPFRIG